MGETIQEVKMTKWYWTYGFGAMILGFFALALFAPDTPPAGKLMLGLIAAVVLVLMPDMSAIYGTDGIMLTYGFKALWKKRLPKNEITRIYIAKYSPMKEFGGWGIKGGWGRMKGVQMWAMPTKEPRAIMVELANGRKYLVGDDNPDETVSMISGIYPVDPGSGAIS